MNPNLLHDTNLVVHETPDTASGAAPREFWLGRWEQDDIGAHPACNLLVEWHPGSGEFCGEYLDEFGPGTLKGMIDQLGWTCFTSSDGGITSYLVGRVEGTSIAGAWILERKLWWRRPFQHRNVGLFCFWPLGADGAGWCNSEPDYRDRPAPFLECAIRRWRGLSAYFPELHRRIDAAHNPIIRQAMQRQCEYLRHCHFVGSQVELPGNNDGVGGNHDCCRRAYAWFDRLDQVQGCELFGRMGRDASDSFCSLRRERNCFTV